MTLATQAPADERAQLTTLSSGPAGGAGVHREGNLLNPKP